jgi:hypothetical protein
MGRSGKAGPSHDGRQCLTYLNSFDNALLVTPTVSVDGFEIASYLGVTLSAAILFS